MVVVGGVMVYAFLSYLEERGYTGILTYFSSSDQHVRVFACFSQTRLQRFVFLFFSSSVLVLVIHNDKQGHHRHIILFPSCFVIWIFQNEGHQLLVNDATNTPVKVNLPPHVTAAVAKEISDTH